MNMSKEHKVVEKEDLLPGDIYLKNRKKIRKDLLEFKKNRRLELGPYATFYFESFETMLGQIQEMVHIEKGGDEQLKDELAAYNPLIPKGNELIATLMFEIDNPITRADFLGKVGGIEKKVYLKVGRESIIAMPEKDVDRTSAEGKASSVQFLHFVFSDEQIKKFKDLSIAIMIGIDHNLYNHKRKVLDNIRSSLIKDFN